MKRQDGFSLLEAVLVAGVVAILSVALSFAAFARPGGASSAAAQFDAAVAVARSIASTSNGSTLVLTSTAGGFAMRVYSGRPASASAMTYSGVADFLASASIVEAHLTAPMTIFFDAAGHASAMSGAVTIGQSVAADPGCPASAASLVFTISDSRASLTRTLRCNT